ncbi:deoxyribodipyrimidine photo-lyase, partial [Aeromonas dhakensis]
QRVLAHWPVAEGEAEGRLCGFVEEGLLAYGQWRDFPAQDGTSSLSAYLAAGVLGPNQCLAAIQASLGTLP